MIPNSWYAIADAREVRKWRPVGVRRFGERLVLWRDGDGALACASDTCAHRGAALSHGEVVEGHVACPFHGFRYDATGRCRLIPSNGRAAEVPPRFKVKAYPAREAHGFVWVFWGAAPEGELPELPFFEDIDGSFRFSTFQDPWPVHYSRCIENQLDVMHLPFAHRTTIGRGNKTLVDGPLVEWLDEDRFRFYVYNRLDDGSSPLPAKELRPEDAAVHLDFAFPNLWQNHLSKDLRIVAAFAPVDEENTLIYLRTYQRTIKIPGLAQLFEWVLSRFNRVILGQDRRIVVTQEPTKTALKMRENLVQGDRPIAEYRRRRQELIDGGS